MTMACTTMERGITAIGFAGLLLVSGAASAQADWTGPYVGAHGAYSFQRGGEHDILTFDADLNGSFGDTVTNTQGANVFSPGFCSGEALGPTPGDGCQEDSDNFEGGIHAGYDWQVQDDLLLGLVASYTRTKVKDSVTAFSTTPANYTFTRQLRNLYAVRGRMGYVIDDSMLYATAGVNYGEIRNLFDSSNTANEFVPFDDNASWGFELGGGAEHRLTETFSLGVQYLYRELTSDNYVVRAAPGTTGPTHPFRLQNPEGIDMRRVVNHFKTQAVEVNANYRF